MPCPLGVTRTVARVIPVAFASVMPLIGCWWWKLVPGWQRGERPVPVGRVREERCLSCWRHKVGEAWAIAQLVHCLLRVAAVGGTHATLFILEHEVYLAQQLNRAKGVGCQCAREGACCVGEGAAERGGPAGELFLHCCYERRCEFDTRKMLQLLPKPAEVGFAISVAHFFEKRDMSHWLSVLLSLHMSAFMRGSWNVRCSGLLCGFVSHIFAFVI